MSLEQLYLRAWIDGLNKRTPAPDVRPVSSPSPYVRLVDTDRPPYLRQRPTGGDRG